ncbi:hypothetical protein ACOMHN_066134 [Nucella lapillus]
MEEERVELEADIEKLHHTLEEDRNQWQYDYIVDSDDDDSEEDDDALYIDLEKQGSAAASVASISVQSAGDKTISSAHSNASQATSATETQSVGVEQEDEGELFREVGVMQEELEAGSSLPASLESCLILNKTYQDLIVQHIARIELELAENREGQRHIEEEAKESSINQMTKKRFPYNATLPYFKMKFGTTPAPNEDTRLKRLTDEPDLDKRPEKAWHAQQKTLLTDAVTEDALEKTLQPLMSRRELEEDKLNKAGKNTEQWHAINERIAALDAEIEEKRNIPPELLLHCVDPEKVDWMKIANMTFEGRRDWTACRRAWVHSIDPRLNQAVMKQGEEERLVALIQETNGTNWTYIAQHLGTGRTPFQCLQYFQQNLNSEMLDRPWSKEEDEELIKVVEKCQHYHFNWRKVSHYMEGRSGMQCYKRYSKLDPNINKGYWTEAEDAQLMAAVQLLGTHNWGRVKELVPGRTREQCRERYCNSLDPNISGKAWTYEEDKMLLKLVAQHGKGNWVKCCKGLPGRTDNQILQRYRRLEDWRRKTEWFKKQSENDRELLQGNNLPTAQRTKTQERNWEQFKSKFGVYPDDYRKQQADMESGDTVAPRPPFMISLANKSGGQGDTVAPRPPFMISLANKSGGQGDTVAPRPPFMIGLANKSGGKVWERRIKLHKLIESHIDRLKEKYNFIHPSVAGVFELQDAISQLSRDCISQRDQLMNKRKDRLGELIHGLPSALNVKDLLAVSRGGKVHEKTVRGPTTPRKKKGKKLAPRLLQSMKIDSQLRKVVRANLKERGMKKGRPRRFFWDINGDQVLADEDVAELKATALGLYLKSLGADHVQLLRSGRRAFPQLFHKKHQQQFQTSDDNDDQHDPANSDSPSSAKKPLRRSRRRHEKMKVESETPAIADPFSLAELPPNVSGFADWQKQRDYQLLEWLAKEQDVTVDDQLSEGVTSVAEVAAAAVVEVDLTSDPRPGQPVIGQGMSLVTARIQQAVEEEEAAGRNRPTGHGSHAPVSLFSDSESGTDTAHGEVTTDADNASTRAAIRSRTEPSGQDGTHGATTSSQLGGSSCAASTWQGLGGSVSSQQPSGSSGATSAPARQFPNLPPTATSVQSFKNLLLKRLGLIKTAGGFYSLPYYQAKKDHQMARLMRAGLVLKDMTRGTIDLSRMMNRVSQETDYVQRQKRQKHKDKPLPTLAPLLPPPPPSGGKQFDFRALESVHRTEEYQLLKARFQSVFTWPALLSAIYPPFQRKEFCIKAGGVSHQQQSYELPTYRSLRKRPPMLKSKGFYRYVNKTKEDKKMVEQKRDEMRILKQVRDLMADENDPKPHVTMAPDSDDETFTGYKPTENPDQDLPPKKRRRPYRKRFRQPGPLRQSSRVTERKVYMDTINHRRKYGPRKPSVEQCPDLPRVRKAGPNRLHPTVRRAMINAMVEARSRVSHKHGTRLGQWNPGCYVSDDDDEEKDLGKELAKGGDWVSELPAELQDNLALFERESLVEPDDAPSHTSGASLPAAATVTSTSLLPIPVHTITFSQPSGASLPAATVTSTTLPIPVHTLASSQNAAASANIPEKRAQTTHTFTPTIIDLTAPSTSQIKSSQISVGFPAAGGSKPARGQPARVGKSFPQSSSSTLSSAADQELSHFHQAVEQFVNSGEPGKRARDVVVLDSDSDEDNGDDDDDGGGQPSVASLLAAKKTKQ